MVNQNFQLDRPLEKQQIYIHGQWTTKHTFMTVVK